jgi:hypothetical protein
MPDIATTATLARTSAEDASSAARQCERADCAGRRSLPMPMPPNVRSVSEQFFADLLTSS